MTSRDVVNVVVRRLPKKTKVGHAGTLDPLAQGVLVLGVGPAVRLVPYLQQLPKRYRAVFQLGRSSDSGDLEGNVVDHPELPEPSRAQIDDAAAQLVGEIDQTPPAYSAVWVDGQRAYKRARAGETVVVPSRRVRIDSLEVSRYEYPELEFETVCGSGTYIRSLGVDLARAAGSNAVMSYLRRVSVGPFHVDNAVAMERLRNEDLATMLIPCSSGVGHLQQICVNDDQSVRLGHGLCIEGTAPLADEEIAAMTSDGQLRAILRWKRDAWCPYRVFPVA